MANGIITLGSTKANLEGRVVWESAVRSIVENNSNVTARIQVRRNDGYTTQGTWSGAMRIGDRVEQFSLPSTYVGSSWVTMLEFTNVQAHADDGKGSCFIEAYCNGPTGTSMAGQSVSGNATVTLDTIPRTSSVTCADGNIGSSTTINIVRASDTFTHTLKYHFGTLTGTIVTKTTSTSYGWTIPTTFYSQIPNAKSGRGTITCETYSGDTLIGSSTCPFNALVLEETNKPTITATVVDTNATTTALTGDANKLVKYFSNARVTMTATAKNSATIVSQKVTSGDGKSSTSATSTLNGIESGTFNLTCTDSRGFVGTNTVTKTMVNYIKLAITSLTIARESSTSDTVKISLKGNYFNASFGSVTNTLTLKWRYRVENGDWSGYTTITPTKSGNTFSYSGTLGTNFDYQQAYEFEVYYEDKLIKDTKTQPVTAGTPLVDMWKGNIKINGTNTATKFVGPLTGNANTSSQVYGTLSNPTTQTNYHIPFYSLETNGYKTLRQNDGLIYSILEGTADTEGKSLLRLGNAIATGTAKNKSGVLRMYSTNTGYTDLIYPNSTAKVTNQLSTHSGNIHSCTNLYNNTSGTSGTVTLSESASNFSYLEIFYCRGGNAQYSSVKIYAPNGKTTSIPNIWYVNDTMMQIQTKNLTISGTSITQSSEVYTNLQNGSTVSLEAQTSLIIVRVDGYK